MFHNNIYIYIYYQAQPRSGVIGYMQKKMYGYLLLQEGGFLKP